jgi:hypothetical protein
MKTIYWMKPIPRERFCFNSTFYYDTKIYLTGYSRRAQSKKAIPQQQTQQYNAMNIRHLLVLLSSLTPKTCWT